MIEISDIFPFYGSNLLIHSIVSNVFISLVCWSLIKSKIGIKLVPAVMCYGSLWTLYIMWNTKNPAYTRTIKYTNSF